MQRMLFRSALSLIALLIGADVWASPSYKDANWGVVPQENGNACVVVLNSADRMHAFHFLVDGVDKVATVGILDSFLPSRLATASTTITVDLGPMFTRQLEFKRHSDGLVGYIAADLSRDDLTSILAALQTTRDVSLSFDNGDVWRIPPPGKEAASAISECWNAALTGARSTTAAVRL
jgi:hypothetical protein